MTTGADGRTLLAGFRVLQLGPGLGAAVCGRLLADAGASVVRSEHSPLARHLDRDKRSAPLACPPDRDMSSQSATLLGRYLDHDKSPDRSQTPDLIVAEGSPATLRARGHDPESLREYAPKAALVLISPYGQTGPDAERPATDLTLMAASGIARMLTGQVDDLSEPPIRAVGEQSAFLGGVAAACAGMHAALRASGSIVDVSIQEALATLAMTELSRAGQTGKSWHRKRETDGNGATVCILPASDGYAAISPREERQWRSWLVAMGSPAWGNEPRFARKPDRIANWDALHGLMCAWSRERTRQQIADLAQAAHVPSFPLLEVAEHLGSPQLAHRGFWRQVPTDAGTVKMPGAPFGLALRQGPAASTPAPAAALPLAGVRVLDFSWVIAGPTATRYLAAMGAEVIKVEAPGPGDPGRASGLHEVLGQAKRGIVLDLKQPAGVEAAQALADRCDVLVENFATGVMDRLGLGAGALQARNPGLVYVSASGLGRTGPESHAVAYGTLLQCYAGFAGLNRHPDRPPRVGMAWLDPMCGLMLAFAVAAALWARRENGTVARVDFSMVEAMLWTMADPLLAAQSGDAPLPRGNADRVCSPHGVYRCAGDDAWIALAVRDDADWRRLCDVVPALSPLCAVDCRDDTARIDRAIAAWCGGRPASDALRDLHGSGVPASALADSTDLVASPHLHARGFWEAHGDGVLPGLPWRASRGRQSGPAPRLGADTDRVLKAALGISDETIDVLRRQGAFG